MNSKIGMKIKRYKGIILLVLSLLMQNIAPLPVHAAGNDKDTTAIQINTAKDLMELSKMCSGEEATIGKTFVLQKDISLKDVAYIPIAVFSGTLEGNGHKITGWTQKDSATDVGFFRFIGKSGKVYNLEVESDIFCQSDSTIIGGIAGTNQGIIENCTYRGSLLAGSKLGGIAGINEKTGIISNCRNFAMITGIKKTGGIAGENKGLIESSTNSGKVNASLKKVNKKELDAEQYIDVENVFEDEDKIERIGGIAGDSSGILKRNQNKGNIGFEHIGYQVGGIVGYQVGCILDCYNKGTVRGRENVAGIAGILEPDVEIKYKEDALQKVDKQLDELDSKVDSLSDSIEDADTEFDNNTEILDKHVDDFSDTADYYDTYFKEKDKKIDREIKNKSNKVDKSVDHVGFEVDTDDLKEKIEELNGQIDTLEDINNSTEGKEKLLETLESLKSTLGSAAQFSTNTLDETDEQVDNIKDAYDDTNDLITYIENEADSYEDELNEADDDLGKRVDIISEQIDKTDDDYKKSEKKVDTQFDIVDGQLKSIKKTVQDGITRLEKRLDEEEFFHDISDNEKETETNGKIIRCENAGEIIADMNCGGIVGKIALDIDNFDDMEIKENGKSSLNYEKDLMACILKCKNYSDLSIKNDYVGGIVGVADYGAMIRCENYGNIKSESGKYAGGIAGKSDYMIRNSYSICNVGAEKYAGGIVGYGKQILKNTAMAAAFCTTSGTAGTIAGDADSKGKISENKFVYEKQGAVNNVTYLKEATAINYSKLIQSSKLPTEFYTFHVKYVANGKALRTITCKYGDKIPVKKIPEIPSKKGYYTAWDKADTNFVNRNMTINAVYKEWENAIATKTNIGNKAVMVAGGDFYAGTKIVCTELAGKEKEIPKGYVLKNAYQYTIISPEKIEGSQFELRLLSNKTKNLAVAIEKGNTYKIIPTKKIGSYLKFYTGAAEGKILLLQKRENNAIWMIVSAVIVFVVCGGFYLYAKKRKTA